MHYMYSKRGPVAKNLDILQNQCKPSQLGKLTNYISQKIVHKGTNYSLKIREEIFCNGTQFKIKTA